MTESSVLYKLAVTVWQRFLVLYGNSVLCKLANKIIAEVLVAWDKSLTRRLLFHDYKYGSFLQDSAVGKAVNTIARFFSKNADRNRRVIENSKVISYLNGVCSSLLFISVRSYGLFCLVFGIGTCAGKLALGGDLGIIFYAAAASIAAGIALVIINRPVSALFNGSVFCRLFGGLFDLSEIRSRECADKHTVLFIALGVVFAVCAVFLSLTNFVIVAGGLTGGVLVLYRTEIGVFAAAFLLPLVPTKIILGLTLITVISYISHFAVGKFTFKFQLLDFFILLFVLMLAYSVFISYKPSGSAPMVSVYILFIGFYFAVKNTLLTRRQLYAVISTIVFSGFIVASLGVLQKLTGSFDSAAMWLDSSMFYDAGPRVYSTLENPNVLGEYLIIIISLTVGMLYYLKQPLYKVATCTVLLVSAYCMLLTLSRGAWLGLLLAFAIFILLNDRKLIWLAVFGLLIAPLVMPRSIIARFLSIGNIGDTSTNYRVNIWLASLLMLKVFWPIGIGLGTQTFVFVYSRFAFNAVYAPHSHNLFLQILLDIGLFGFLMFAGYTAVYFKNLLLSQRLVEAKKPADTFLKVLPCSLCAALGGYLLQGMTDNVWYNYRVVCLFWLLLALSGVVYNTTKEEVNNGK